MKVRKLKKVLFSRRWFSKRIADDPWNQGQMCFLAYGDTRSHQKVRWPSSGKRGLVSYLDDMHLFHKENKKDDNADQRFLHREVREYRKTHRELRRMSFHACIALRHAVLYAKRVGFPLAKRFRSSAHLITHVQQPTSLPMRITIASLTDHQDHRRSRSHPLPGDFECSLTKSLA